MAVFSGPEIPNNGLVFHYDMSNSVKSWKGAPTTNINTALAYTQGWINSGAAAYSANDNTITRLFSDHPTSSLTVTTTGNCHIGMGNATITSGLTYAVSLYCFIPSSAGTLAGAAPYMRTFPANLGRGQLLYNGVTDWNTWPKDTWIRVGSTFVNTAGDTSMYISCYLDNLNNKIYLSAPMIENQTFVTPYINGTRSTTQTIIDLTGNNTVTATSLTYASDNTFSFNGTSSNIIGPTSGILDFGTNPFTILFVAYRTADGFQGGSYINKGLGTATGFGMRDNAIYLHSSLGFIASVNVATTINTWQHHALVVDQNSSPIIKHYINGVLNQTGYTETTANKGSITNSEAFNIGYSFAGGIARYFNGNMPLVQIYNRSLSVLEVQQNFEATRGRFGI